MKDKILKGLVAGFKAAWKPFVIAFAAASGISYASPELVAKIPEILAKIFSYIPF